jgi:NAD+ kinase
MVLGNAEPEMGEKVMRSALLVLHPTRPEAVHFAQELIAALTELGISSITNYPGGIHGSQGMAAELPFEIAVVLGGDGTILRAAELVLGTNIPVLGINLGNVGFLAEIDRPSAARLAEAIANKNYRGESRLLLQHEVHRAGKVIATGWALNEFTVERSHSQIALFLDGAVMALFVLPPRVRQRMLFLRVVRSFGQRWKRLLSFPWPRTPSSRALW